jgi:hypothetical protein
LVIQGIFQRRWALREQRCRGGNDLVTEKINHNVRPKPSQNLVMDAATCSIVVESLSNSFVRSQLSLRPRRPADVTASGHRDAVSIGGKCRDRLP